mgnify:CR=1 FL=1
MNLPLEFTDEVHLEDVMSTPSPALVHTRRFNSARAGKPGDASSAAYKVGTP